MSTGLMNWPYFIGLAYLLKRVSAKQVNTILALVPIPKNDFVN